MRVVVVGAGEVGSYVADLLAKEGNDVSIIDVDPRRINYIEAHVEAYTVLGSGTNPSTLRAAGIAEADMLIAVSSVDEVNLVACLLGKQHGVDRSVARIEDASLRSRDAEELHEVIGAEIIDPDDATADEILRLLEFPGASEVAVLGDGEVIMIGTKLRSDAPLCNQTLSDIAKKYEPDWDFMVATISRGGETIIPRSDQTLHEGDILRVICKRRARRELTRLLGLTSGKHRRIMLLGGGRTAALLAQRLHDRNADVVLFERQPDRARYLAETLDGVLVIEEDITDAEALDEEEVGEMDAVIALTGQDDANILACLYAKSMGAAETIAVLHRLELRELLQEVGIDVALSPRTASANAVLKLVRGGVQVATFLASDIEVLELAVEAKSKADGAAVCDLGLPREVLICAIVRDGKPQIGRRWSELRERDHIVVVARPQHADEVRSLFSAP